MTDNSTAVTVFKPAELSLITNTVAKGASKEELDLFLYVAGKRGLNPLTRQIHFVKRGDQGTIQTGIDGFRLIAERTGRYAPSGKPTHFEYDKNGRLLSATVYGNKIVNGTAFEFSGIAFFDEYAPRLPNGRLFPMWEKMPKTMLEKCAEAKMLRKGFPEELSGIYTDDEMHQADTKVNINIVEADEPAGTPENAYAQPQEQAGEDAPICPIHGVPWIWFKKGSQGWWAHKNDDGSWCNRSKVEKETPAPAEDTGQEETTPAEASQGEIDTVSVDWTSKTKKEFLDEMVRISRGKGMLPADVKEFLEKVIHVPDSNSIMRAQRNDVIQKLTELNFEPK